MDALPPEAERLFRVPPEEFVAERGRLARRLREAGDRAAAAKVAKLRKPTAAAWALNRVAEREPGLMAKLVQCAGNLRQAHARGGDELRRATATYRDIMRDVTAAAREEGPGGRPLSAELTDRVRDTLLAAAADPELAADIRAGRLAAERTGAVLPDLPAAPAPERSDGDDDRGGDGDGGDGDAGGGAAADPDAAERAERRRALERRLEAARERREARRSALAEAQAAVDELRAELRRAETALRRAQDDLEDAEDDVAHLSSERDALE